MECGLGFLNVAGRSTKQLGLVHVAASSETAVNQKNVPAAVRVVETREAFQERVQ
jgi:hypothetical protein